MKNKIIKENVFDGVYILTIQNKYGKYSGRAYCSPEDMKDYSDFCGARYAEIRANAAFAKDRLKQEKIKLKTIQNLLKDIEYDNKCNEDYNPYLHRIKIKLRDYSQSVEDWQNLYNYLNTAVAIQDEARQKILARAKEEKKNK